MDEAVIESGTAIPRGEAPVPAPVRLASCVTDVIPLEPPPVNAMLIELPEGVIEIPLPGRSVRAPVNPFRLVTPAAPTQIVGEAHLESRGVLRDVRELRAGEENRARAIHDSRRDPGVDRRKAGHDLGDVRLQLFERIEREGLLTEQDAVFVEDLHVDLRRGAGGLDESEVVPEVLRSSLVQALDRSGLPEVDREPPRHGGEEETFRVAEVRARGLIENSLGDEDFAGRADPRGADRRRQAEALSRSRSRRPSSVPERANP